MSGKIILNFGVQKRLWASLNPIFTGGATLSVTPYGVPERVAQKRKTAEGFPSAVFRMIGGSKMIFARS